MVWSSKEDVQGRARGVGFGLFACVAFVQVKKKKKKRGLDQKRWRPATKQTMTAKWNPEETFNALSKSRSMA